MSQQMSGQHGTDGRMAPVLDDVDRINSLIVDRLAPLQQRLDDAGAAFPAEVAELLAVSATDAEGQKRSTSKKVSIKR